MKKNSFALAFSVVAISAAFVSGCHSHSSQVSTDSPRTVAPNVKPTTETSTAVTKLMYQGACAKDPNVTIALYRRAVQIDPTNMVNLSVLGFALKFGGKNQEALKVFQKLGKSDDPVWQKVAKTQTKVVLQKMQHNS